MLTYKTTMAILRTKTIAPGNEKKGVGAVCTFIMTLNIKTRNRANSLKFDKKDHCKILVN